ncbi:hypothetical protein [Actinoplanes sp. N902-109]|uniref:hypothetical protein n=1 Tax=Actinoplanes sp. (strain N902-109) TaxID=649831 RepID=UPI0003295C3C|nr:hypothetical protein [Actinoplanes sp. N902-109]AGL16918.1 hypothetical protein L083_3408 [Actinoplanes sp. N902-109]
MPFRPAVGNVGDAATSGVLLHLTLPAAPPARDRYRNCYYSGKEVFCPFPRLALAPGERARISAATPLIATVPVDTIGLSTLDAGYAFEPMPAGVPYDPGDARPGTGPLLRLERLATTLADSPDADFLDSAGTVWLHVAANPADLVAGGGTLRAPNGATVSLVVRMTNRGPATVAGWSGPDPRWDDPAWASLTVDVPPGVEVLSSVCFSYAGDVLDFFRPGLDRYRCLLEENLGPGSTVQLGLRVRLISDRPSTGRVTAAGGSGDPRPGNNTATVVVRPTAPAPAPGQGGGAAEAGAGLPITGAAPADAFRLGAALVVTGMLLVVPAAWRRTRVRRSTSR